MEAYTGPVDDHKALRLDECPVTEEDVRIRIEVRVFRFYRVKDEKATDTPGNVSQERGVNPESKRRVMFGAKFGDVSEGLR